MMMTTMEIVEFNYVHELINIRPWLNSLKYRDSWPWNMNVLMINLHSYHSYFGFYFTFLGYFYCLNMTLLSLSTFASTIVVHLHFQRVKSKHVPPWLIKVSDIFLKTHVFYSLCVGLIIIVKKQFVW